MANLSHIQYLFEPKSVAVIGASTNPRKIGYKVVENIISGGYEGHIYPINLNGGQILGQSVYRSLDEVDGDVDVAVITIPANGVFEAVQQCAAKGVKYLPIISSGFSEIGNTEAETQIVTYALEHGMRVLGPNIFGIYSAQVSLNATFGPGNIKAGNVAIITQSGALGIAMIGKTAVENIGLSTIISVGNKSDLDEADLLAYLTQQERTKVILMYIEGVKAGQRFISVLKEATHHKPVVVIKSGRSKRGAVAAASHTGSLAGADEIFDDIMKQCGVIRADTLQDAFEWAKFLANTPLPQGKNTVIVTNGGGVGVMATDACEKYGVNLYDDAHTLHQIFNSVTPDFGSTKNPIDLTGGATSEDYDTALATALTHDQIDAVIALYCETALFDADKLTKMVAANYAKFKANQKPIVFSILGGEVIENSLTALRKEQVPIFSDVYSAVSSLGVAYRYRSYLLEDPDSTDEVRIDTDLVNGVIDTVLQEHRSFLLAHEAKQVMDVAGVTLPGSKVARNLMEAVKFAEEIGYPVVMKVVSKDILHKSDAGGVALDLENREEVMDAYQAIIRNCRAYKPGVVITGIEVSQMILPGTEVIIGARRDRTFGPIIMFGLGGIYVEVMKDVSFRALPVDRRTVISMIEQIKSYPLLLGVRGEEKKDIDGIIDTVIKLAAILQNCERIADIEINPLMVYEQGQGVKAVDARILIS